MSEITRVGADLAKRVIQVHAVDASGKLVTNRALPRDKFVIWCAQLSAGCLVAMEASSGAHHWARKHGGLGPGCPHHPGPSGGPLPAAGLSAAAPIAPARNWTARRRSASGRPAACKAGRKERCQRCRCHLRSGLAPADAFCADQNCRAAKHVVCAPPARSLERRARRCQQ